MAFLELIKREFNLLVKLGRLKMTVFSAVTYSTAYSLAMHYDNNNTLDTSQFLYGWAFVLLCQLSAHFLGEYYDFRADRLNKQGSPFTGGSRVLVDNGYSPQRCLILGWSCCISSLLTLYFALPTRVHLVGYCMVFMATQYSGAPFRFNHRNLGEISAALVMNVLLPYYSALLASPTFVRHDTKFPYNFWFFEPKLAMLVVPAALIKFALFLVLNLADRRSDWLAGKITLPVTLGDRITAQLHALTMNAAYVSVICIYLQSHLQSSLQRRSADLIDAATILGMLLTAVPGLAISRDLLSPARPYHINHVVFRSLKHAPLPLVVLFVDCFVRELISAPSVLGHVFSLNFQLRCLVIYPYLYNVLFGKSPPPFILSPPAPAATAPDSTGRVIIAGGGVSGLVLAACLQRLHIPYLVIEKKSRDTHDDGADLGLWPASIQILSLLGVPDHFWQSDSYPVKRVYMTKLGNNARDHREDVLKLVDMTRVVSGTGEQFRLIGRQALMTQLLALVDPANIMYATKIVSVEESANGVTVQVQATEQPKFSIGNSYANGNEFPILEMRGRIVVGSDGINSLCRSVIRAATGKTDDASRYCGELCYRGVCDLIKGSEISTIFLENEKKKPAAMTIFYGDGIRASWGMIDQKNTQGFWWIKVKSSTPDPDPIAPLSWPHPLNLLHQSTDPALLYVHPILDRVPSNKWCSERIVLVGDAAHPVTPNMGQGANMSIEDVFVLSILLSRYYHYEKDGHQEAFYNYFKTRHPHTTKIANESYQQSKMGQWTNPYLIKLRETLMRLVPASVLQNKLRKVNLFNVQPWLDEFKQKTNK